MGNCGVTFAPCRPEDRAYLAELMECVEDIPRDAIMGGLPWDWVTYGEYLGSMERLPKGPNVGGMVGHCAVRHHAMGERSLDDEPATADDIAAMVGLVDEAMDRRGARASPPRARCCTPSPDGRPVPGTWATPDELLRLRRRAAAGTGAGCSRVRPALGERDGEDLAGTRAEVAWMGEVSRRSGRPVTFGLGPVRSAARPASAASSASPRRRTPPAGASALRPPPAASACSSACRAARPFDRSPAWQELRGLSLQEQLLALRDPARRSQLIAEAEEHPPRPSTSSASSCCRRARPATTARPTSSLAAHAEQRGVSPAAAFIELALETDGALVCNYPFLNQRLGAVEEMLDDPLVTLGLADAGAHVGQIMDASQPTFYLTYWIRERGRWGMEEAVRRLTSDTAQLFGIDGPGRAVPGCLRRRQRHRPRRADAPPARVRPRLPGRRRPLRPGQQRATTTRSSTARCSWTTASTPALLAGDALRRRSLLPRTASSPASASRGRPSDVHLSNRDRPMTTFDCPRCHRPAEHRPLRALSRLCDRRSVGPVDLEAWPARFGCPSRTAEDERHAQRRGARARSSADRRRRRSGVEARSSGS